MFIIICNTIRILYNNTNINLLGATALAVASSGARLLTGCAPPAAC